MRKFETEMKVVLQNKLSRFYYGMDDNWTADHSQARDFASSLNALDFVQKKKIEHSQVVLKFQDTKYDIVLHSFSDSLDRKRAD